jgi:hypothetical protein
MFKLLRKTALWILLAPCAIWGAGLASNQAVLNANHDKFPVMWNEYKVAKYALSLQKAVDAADADLVANPDDEDAQAADMQANLDLEALTEEGFLDDTHVIMSTQTHLNWLADVWDFKSEGTYSIGDFLLMFGGWLLPFALPIWLFEVVRKLMQE